MTGADGADPEMHALFYTCHLLDGMRCRGDFDPARADKLRQELSQDSPLVRYCPNLRGRVLIYKALSIGTRRYIMQCIVDTGDRLLFNPHGVVRKQGCEVYGATFRKCSIDAWHCISILAAVPRTGLAAPDPVSVDIDADHWKILLAAAQCAFHMAYSRPFAAASSADDDQPLEYADGTVVHRRNHSLAHALRQAWYAPLSFCTFSLVMFVLRWLGTPRLCCYTLPSGRR